MRPVLDRREYAVGILLLLVVVFLWTSSNFVTQVSVALCSAAFYECRSVSEGSSVGLRCVGFVRWWV